MKAAAEPRLVFFSGGTALGPLSRVLKTRTANSTHLITPFDSGGSSRELRRAFDMPSIGDLRNRMVALADESARQNSAVYRLFCYRLPKTEAPEQLRRALAELVLGSHPLIADIQEPVQPAARKYLQVFAERMPSWFDLGGANIGNLMLAGAYLDHDRQLAPVLATFSRLLGVRGTVLPITTRSLHLCAELEDGSLVVGQRELTGKEAAPIASRVRDLYLVRSEDDTTEVNEPANQAALDELAGATLICYPMGSFYTSVVANLLPRGVGRVIQGTTCPKVYVPNAGRDPEMFGMSVLDAVHGLLRFVRKDAADEEIPTDRIVTHVLLDTQHLTYPARADVTAIETLGIQVMDMELGTRQRPHELASAALADALLSLARSH